MLSIGIPGLCVPAMYGSRLSSQNWTERMVYIRVVGVDIRVISGRRHLLSIHQYVAEDPPLRRWRGCFAYPEQENPDRGVHARWVELYYCLRFEILAARILHI